MINVVEEFKKYLEGWNKKYNKKVDYEVVNADWTKAWDSFMKEYLVNVYEELKQGYKDMKFLKVGEVNKNTEVKSEEVSKSTWEEVKELMNE